MQIEQNALVYISTHVIMVITEKYVMTHFFQRSVRSMGLIIDYTGRDTERCQITERKKGREKKEKLLDFILIRN